MQTWVFFQWIHINLPFSNWEREYKRMRMKKNLHYRNTHSMADRSSKPQKAFWNIWRGWGGEPLLGQNEPAAGEQCGK